MRTNLQATSCNLLPSYPIDVCQDHIGQTGAVFQALFGALKNKPSAPIVGLVTTPAGFYLAPEGKRLRRFRGPFKAHPALPMTARDLHCAIYNDVHGMYFLVAIHKRICDAQTISDGYDRIRSMCALQADEAILLRVLQQHAPLASTET